jgi:hypothetical protein
MILNRKHPYLYQELNLGHPACSLVILLTELSSTVDTLIVAHYSHHMAILEHSKVTMLKKAFQLHMTDTVQQAHTVPFVPAAGNRRWLQNAS